MDNLEPSLEQYEQSLNEIDSISKYGRTAHLDNQPSMETLRDIDRRFEAVISNEEIDAAKIRRAADVVKRASFSAIGSVKRFLESIKVAFDRTNQAGLERARRMLAAAEGDNYQKTVVTDKTLAKHLHVAGDVPEDFSKATARLLTDAKFFRTMVVPNIDRDVQQAANLTFGASPRTEEEFHAWIMKVIAVVGASKSLVDFLDDQALASEYPGGLKFALPTNRMPAIQENRKIKDAPSIAVLRKLEKTVARGWTIPRNPSLNRTPVRSSTVRLLSRAQVEDILNFADTLIKEGHAVSQMSKIFKGYSASGVSQGIDMVVSAMDGHIYIEEDADGEKSYTTDKIDIDSDDRSRATWCGEYFGLGVVQHHLMLPNIATILYAVANGYIKLAEASIKHFK